MQVLSGPQVIYLGLGNNPESEKGVCRVCGGPLLGPSVDHMETSSGTWTDENICRRLDHARCCVACNWFRTGHNRQQYWNKQSVVVATPEAIWQTDYASFFEKVKEAPEFIDIPSVILVRGDNTSLTQKHQQWKTISSVNYSKDRFKITIAGLRFFRSSTELSGVVDIARSELIETVTTMIHQIETYLEPTTKYMKTEWQKRNYYIRELLQAYKNHNDVSVVLCAHLAAHVVTKEEA